MYRIVFIEGVLKGRKLTVHEDRLCLGRDPDCSLRFSDPAVAAHHAELEEREGVVRLRRVSPAAGLTVNGNEAGDGETSLRAGDVLGLGAHRLRIGGARPEPVATSSSRAGGLSDAAVAATLAILAIQALLIFRAVDHGRQVRADAPAAAPEAETNTPYASLSPSIPGLSMGAPPPAAAPTAAPTPLPESAPDAILKSEMTPSDRPKETLR